MLWARWSPPASVDGTQQDSESTGLEGAGTLCPWLAASASTLVTG